MGKCEFEMVSWSNQKEPKDTGLAEVEFQKIKSCFKGKEGTLKATRESLPWSSSRPKRPQKVIFPNEACSKF